MGFSKQEYWSGLPFLHQGIFTTQGLKLGLQHCRQTLYHLSYQGSSGLGIRSLQTQRGEIGNQDCSLEDKAML